MFKDRAVSYADAIQTQTGIQCELETGKRGMFSVVVDGECLVSRKGGIIAKLTGKPWPEIDDVVAIVKSHIEKS